ncbi:peptidoglycan-binding protein [Megasphaera vaginalis (ex Bordigoni et al. 2020)]|uniref:peptidoglycan-binding protein n=1 Tax=Megasphaera vaginalis (ex Bordigoni et al. 2020) TaxID=2045301 RepID=UPI001F23B417|nr:peptidoglycan-binding protein [Megasphaera vaginalis (ex Bordigoni et al. 2020)]
MNKRIRILFTALFIFVCSAVVYAKLDVGMTGAEVQSVQYMLSDTGYLTGGADGVFGSGTQAAVKRFQADHGLTVDGIVGTQTMAALSAASDREVRADSQGQSQKKIVMEATAYSAEDPGNCGVTAMGHQLKRGCVSVDPNVIPLGSRLYIEGYGYAVADDTGGSIVGNRIDLAMDSNAEALNFGRKDVVVHVL